MNYIFPPIYLFTYSTEFGVRNTLITRINYSNYSYYSY